MNLADKTLAVIYQIEAQGQPKRYEVTGQTAKALIALYEAGEAGTTAQEVAGWAYRLAAYVHVLRHDYGLEIRMTKEPHFGGWHARYSLVTVIQIIEMHEV